MPTSCSNKFTPQQPPPPNMFVGIRVLQKAAKSSSTKTMDFMDLIYKKNRASRQ